MWADVEKNRIFVKQYHFYSNVNAIMSDLFMALITLAARMFTSTHYDNLNLPFFCLHVHFFL